MYQFPVTFLLAQRWMLLFISQPLIILMLIGMLLSIIWDIPWEGKFNMGTSVVGATEFCDRVQVEIDTYTPNRKYQIKLHSSLILSGLRWCHCSQKSIRSLILA